MAKHTKALEKVHGDGDDKGCVQKCIGSRWSESNHGSYRYKGYKATVDDPDKKDLYNIDFTKKSNGRRLYGLGAALKRLKVNDPRKDKKAWWIGHVGNFENTASKPYKQNSHHILPVTALNKALKATEKKFLMQAGYNVNEGVNVIILPCWWQIRDAVELPDHPGAHTGYNAKGKQVVNDIVLKIEDQEHESYEDDAAELKDWLDWWSDETYWELTEWGEAEVGGASNSINRAHLSI